MELLQEIASYWNTRTEGYSEVNQKELHGTQRTAWLQLLQEHFPPGTREDLKILDIGTGPGFFPIILSEAGYSVTAVDYTDGMLEKAKENIKRAEAESGKDLAHHIVFRQMDAQNLQFPDETFDVIISRNLTWNLEEPARAYSEWYRVLKYGGKLLNFDANWYNYLYDDDKRAAFDADRSSVREAGLEDHSLAEDIDQDRMEKIALQMPLSAITRPEWDVKVLKSILFSQVVVDTQVGDRLWSEEEKLNYHSTPMFMIEAVKAPEADKDRIVSYWSKRSGSFGEQRRAELHNELAGRWMTEMKRYLPEGKQLKILDVGCGAGFFSILLAKEGHEVIGIDLTPDMIEQARILAEEEKCSCRFEVMDAEHPLFEDASFDAVVSRNLTWTLPHADLAYEEWLRILKPGGVLLNTDADYGHEKETRLEELPPKHAHHTLGDEVMEENEQIKKGLAISTCRRPAWDVNVLKYAGVKEEQILVDEEIGRRVYLRKDEFYNPTPVFLICARK